jgi:hypothetical protein
MILVTKITSHGLFVPPHKALLSQVAESTALTTRANLVRIFGKVLNASNE